MIRVRNWGAVLGILLAFAVAGISFGQAKSNTLTCVGLYSETSLGSVSYQVGSGGWVVIKAGDVIPANAQVRVNVPQDWIELIPTNDPNTVYLISGSDSGDVTMSVAEILKSTPRTVSFPRQGSSDPKFRNAVVVVQYNSRDIFRQRGKPGRNIQYGDILDASGTISIIAINTTITLMKPDGSTFKVVGPLTFSVEKAMTGQKIYKYLNAP